MDKFVYLDNAATTPIKGEVIEVMQPHLYEGFGNASSMHQLGRAGKEALEFSRLQVANALGCYPEEVFFTSSGTESNNLAIIGVAFANKFKGNHIIVSSIEHPSILKPCKYLEENGFEVTYLPVDEHGLISIEDLESQIKDSTVLISIMYANNEIGTIEPIEEIGILAKERDIYFHTDAVQAVGSIDINVKDLNIDLLSVSAHKLYGPKGICAIYIKQSTVINPILLGGGQEYGMRSGTENIASCVGFGKAIELATKDIFHKSLGIKALRDLLIKKILTQISNSSLNGHPVQRLPGNVNISFKSINARHLAALLDRDGIYVSSGSACSCHLDSASHVLLAIGRSEELAFSSIRFSLGEFNSQGDIEKTMLVLKRELRGFKY